MSAWYIIYIIVLGLQFIYLYGVFRPLGLSGLKNRASTVKSADLMPVSILIIVKNEKDNLDVLMPLLLAQDYNGPFDIHVVDDQSTDGSRAMLESWQYRFPQKIFLHRMQYDQEGGKKKALMHGLDQSTHDLLLLTDADCRPATNRWIAKMVRAMGPEDSLVLGYAPDQPIDNPIDGMMQLETTYTALLYLGFALKDLAYMGVGRNLLYRKQALLSSQNLYTYQHVLSGDDDLTINELSKSHKIAIQLDPDSFVSSIPKATWRLWLRQKSRHVSTARYYRPVHQLLLGFYYSTLILSWALPFILYWIWPPVILVFLISKLVYYFSFKILVKKVFDQDWNVIRWLKAEAQYIISLLILSPAGLFKKIKKW